MADSVDCESTWLAEQGNETGTVLPIYLLRLIYNRVDIEAFYRVIMMYVITPIK